MWSPFANDDSIRRVIRAAGRAPSLHGRPPCSFWIQADDRIDLRALPEHSTDPLRRELIISCGAALFNLRLAMRVAGHDITVWPVPDPEADPSLLASVEIVTSRIRRPDIGVQELFAAIPRRRMAGSPRKGLPIPENILADMKLAALGKQGWLRVLNRRQVKAWLEHAARDELELVSGKTYTAGPRTWTRPVPPFGAGIQLMSLATRAGLPTSRAARRQVRAQPANPHHDRELDWLRAGQAMQCAMLTGARYGVAATFLTQPLELADVRKEKREWPWDWPFSEMPQMVVRVAGEARGDVVTRWEQFPEVTDLRKQRRRRVGPLSPLPQLEPPEVEPPEKPAA